MKPPRDIGLYLHIPFCRQRCHFCAFYLETARSERIESFLSALEREIRLYARQNLLGGRSFRSIYFGGGTPTAIPVRRLTSLLGLIRTTFRTAPHVEVTIEAHPSTVSPDDLRTLADAGFNRISFGAESMDEKELGPIGRPGSVKDTTRAVMDARTAGFPNINLDLMYGLPGQTVDTWMETLRSILALEPSHVSCYALTVEEGTRLAHDIARGVVEGPEESVQVEMECVAEHFLTSAGFEQYEISNYAKPGHACTHNLLYWTDGDYLGLGPSAQSYVTGIRFGNVADLTAYIEQVSRTRLPVSERIRLSASEQERDAFVFGLRMLKGIPVQTLGSYFPRPGQHRVVDRLIAQGLLESLSGRIRLTRLGRRYADTVATALF